MTNVYDPAVLYRTEAGWFNATTGASTLVEYPNDTNVGIAALDGWTPTATIGAPGEENFVGFQFSEPGGVLEDVRIYGSLLITAPHITVRRCEIIGGTLDNGYGNQVGNDLLIEDCTFKLDPAGVDTTFSLGFPGVGTTGMLLRRCAIIDYTEGVRVGGSVMPLRDPTYTTGHGGYLTKLYNCYIRITGPHPCSPTQGDDYHGDGIQAFDDGLAGVGLTMRNCAIRSVDQYTTAQDGTEPVPFCGGTSCMIAGKAHAKPYDLDRVIMSGAGFSFVCENGGIFKNLFFEQDSAVFGPISLPPPGSPLGGWDLVDEATFSAYIGTLDANGQPDVYVNSIPYGWPGFGPLDPPP